ncbi:hypothetical protein M406DRAFT_322988 [Cryphonectria parasitica EP155]|uniref:Rhodopsin domain-containing protein n=1 Tax=Cryphonectria parasitica (strain ATCC 38755 / EP155) TaxID=660469 RepID=A0A9P4XY30_CRYP1|nr:uncharacterized protein M406DRAFT_322988 [Cryphonectria parasitica EP155]KAF3763034.1 hypothetical protein M406DRAFT_322988 [Cryphonectria parasitica EP155]
MGYSFEDVIQDPSEGKIIILVLITIPLCILATILRVVATKRGGRKLAWDDLFAVLALVGFLVYAICPLATVAVATDMSDYDVEVLSAKLAYIVTPFFYVNQLFAKGSLFVLYHRIFQTDPTFKIWVYVLAAIHVCWFITFIFLLLFLCNPISKWWDVDGTQPGSCINGNAFLVSEETINSAMDFAMIALAVYVVQKLQMKRLVKTKLTFIFVMGGLSGVIGFVKIGLVYSAANTAGQENNSNAFWDLLQMATSIFCACAPMYKSFIPLQNIWRRIASSMRSWSSKTRLYLILPNSSKGEAMTGSGETPGRKGVPQTAENGARFLRGSQIEYTWFDGELVDDIQLSNRDPSESKHGRVEQTVDMV